MLYNAIGQLFYFAVSFESDVMKSIMYVAIFVICMFLLSGVLKGRSANNKVKDALEEFIGFLKNNDFAGFKERYPSFIEFADSQSQTARERMEDIVRQQEILFDEAMKKYQFENITDIKIERIHRQPFQYELRTDANVKGQLVFMSGDSMDFEGVLQQNKMYSLMIENECIFNHRCYPNRPG